MRRRATIRSYERYAVNTESDSLTDGTKSEEESSSVLDSIDASVNRKRGPVRGLLQAAHLDGTEWLRTAVRPAPLSLGTHAGRLGMAASDGELDEYQECDADQKEIRVETLAKRKRTCLYLYLYLLLINNATRTSNGCGHCLVKFIIRMVEDTTMSTTGQPNFTELTDRPSLPLVASVQWKFITDSQKL